MEAYEWPVKTSGYELIGPVGQGSYGLVWKSKCIDPESPHNQQMCAIKIVNMELF